MWSTSLCSHGSGRCRVPGMWAHLGADLTPIIFSISRAVPRVALPSTFSPPESTALRRLCSRTSPTGLQASVSYVTAVSAHIYSCFCARWTCGSLNPLLGISNEQSRGSTLSPPPPPDSSLTKEAHLGCRHRRFPGHGQLKN